MICIILLFLSNALFSMDFDDCIKSVNISYALIGSGDEIPLAIKNKIYNEMVIQEMGSDYKAGFGTKSILYNENHSNPSIFYFCGKGRIKDSRDFSTTIDSYSTGYYEIVRESIKERPFYYLDPEALLHCSFLDMNCEKIGPNRLGLAGIKRDNKWQFGRLQDLDIPDLDIPVSRFWYVAFLISFVYKRMMSLFNVVSQNFLNKCGLGSIGKKNGIHIENGEVICLHPLENKYITLEQKKFMLNEQQGDGNYIKTFLKEKESEYQERLLFAPNGGYLFSKTLWDPTILTKQDIIKTLQWSPRNETFLDEFSGNYLTSKYSYNGKMNLTNYSVTVFNCNMKEQDHIDFSRPQHIQLDFLHKIALFRLEPLLIKSEVVVKTLVKEPYTHVLYSFNNNRMSRFTTGDSRHESLLFETEFDNCVYSCGSELFINNDCLLYPMPPYRDPHKMNGVSYKIFHPYSLPFVYTLDSHKAKIVMLIRAASRLLDLSSLIEQETHTLQWLMSVESLFKACKTMPNIMELCWHGQEKRSMYSQNVFKQLDKKKEDLLETIITTKSSQYNEGFKQNIHELVTDKNNSLFLNSKSRNIYITKLFYKGSTIFV